MDEGPPADRADFAVAKETSERQRSESLRDRFCIVIRRSKEPDSAPIARAQYRGDRPSAIDAVTKLIEQLRKIKIGGRGIARLKLNRLPRSR